MSTSASSASLATTASSARDAWRAAALPEWQSQCETIAQAILAQQEQADQAKKRLIEKSRTFKQTASEVRCDNFCVAILPDGLRCMALIVRRMYDVR